MATKPTKKERQDLLIKLLEDNPFMSDEELSENLKVSIQSIRLYRMQLGIPEVRERIKKAAKDNTSKIVGVFQSDIVGEIIDLQINKSGVSILETTKYMTFKGTDVVKGYYVFAVAETLALAMLDKKVAITGVANVKYVKPIRTGDKLIAKGEVIQKRENDYIVHVKVNVKGEQVFRSKFIVVPIE